MFREHQKYGTCFLLQFCTHNVTLDMDKIVHTVAGPGRKFECYIYQLDLKQDEVNAKRKSRRIQAKALPEKTTGTQYSRSRRIRHRNTGLYNEDNDEEG